MNKIIDLQETSPNFWKARYRGNHGIYTVKIETDGKDIRNFSCSCPSDYYPCKHIPIVREAINDRISKNRAKPEKGVFENVVRKMSLNDLQEFVIRFGLHNTSFQQAVLLEFTPPHKHPGGNNYSEIIRCALEDIDFDSDDIYDYHYEGFEIDALDQWLKKAREYIEQGNDAEAILIAKACIEEYADWARGIDIDLDGYISEDYLYEPFSILEKAYENGCMTAEELLAYCKKEVGKNKYDRTSVSMFNNLIMNLTEDTNPEAYIVMQDKLFNNLSDKSSYEAKQILERKIDFYKKRDDAQTAQRIIEENLQIEAFRQKVVKKMIADNKFKEAKKLINEYIKSKESHNSFNGYNSCWDEYLLEIAGKENDTKEIRKISRKFIDRTFRLTYYQTYRLTFSKEEWPAECEKLIKHYQKGSIWFISSIADIFVEEKQTARLLAYLTKHLRCDILEQYYKNIADEFPEETIALFRRTVDEQMKNTGRDIYENTVRHFESMFHVKGGEGVVKQMIGDYTTQYRTRKAMVEIFTRFSKSRL